MSQEKSELAKSFEFRTLESARRVTEVLLSNRMIQKRFTFIILQYSFFHFIFYPFVFSFFFTLKNCIIIDTIYTIYRCMYTIEIDI